MTIRAQSFRFYSKTLNLVRPDLDAFGVPGRSAEQRIALPNLLDYDIGIVSLGGKAGCGKTFLALAAGLDAVLERQTRERITVFRPLYAVGGQDLVYLPGTAEEKMDPWAAAVFDALRVALPAVPLGTGRRPRSFSGTGQPWSTASPRVAAATVRTGDSPVIMTTVTSHPVSLRRQVRDLREGGMSVKQIARTLGKKASEIAPLVNAMAAEDTPQETDPGVVGCWVSPGWSIGLTVHGHPEWRDRDDTADFPGGIAAVLVARRHRTDRVSVCGYLVDTYCLGVKDALGPRVMSDRDLPTFVHVYFDGFEPAGPPLRAPLELARHLVYGGVDAASRLGFEPHADFVAAAEHLGPWTESSAITFGRHGAPFYVAGPYDHAGAVIATLTETVGEDNFTFVAPVDPAGLSVW